MKSISSFLLAGTALVALSGINPPASAGDAPFKLAQADTRQQKDSDTCKDRRDREPAARPQQNQRPAAQQQPQQTNRPAAQQSQQDNRPAARERQNERPAAQTQPAPQNNRAVQQQPPRQAPSTTVQNPADNGRSTAVPAASADKKDNRNEAEKANADKNKNAAEKSNADKADKTANDRNRNADQNTNRNRDADRNDNRNRNRNADQNDNKRTPAADSKPAQAPNQAQTPSQDKPASSAEFIRRDNNAPRRSIDDLRKERKEVREGNRTVIKEGDRTIVKEGNRTIIRHDEGMRFTIGSRGVQTIRAGNETRTVITRPNGSRIINITDANGRLIKRVREDARGRQFVLINNQFRGVRPVIFVALPPPVIRIPRDRYIVDYRVGVPAPLVYQTLVAEPVEPLAEHYSLEQVRYSEPLRARMPRVDLDINFETGSWQLTPDQVDKLAVVAEGLNKAIAANPNEIFLIEGHTDAVGSDEDNLSLSDRRAEAVAVALTEQFQVPPENLVTQGYGEENLKVATQGAEEANRRVAVRRVTPLLAQSDEPATSGQRQ
jgi:outer membrane protein OmpA-like peptidoglycan-associated protein